ncbi:alpha/beta fold hydrolase [Caldimonas brevitalea]|nr:alpha/beta hydrolase [Caldimonas brevitalea]
MRIFYREAGPTNAPHVLLLHGFGASSAMFRDLIPQLATRYHVIAPDLPGFGLTEVPAARRYRYSFASIAQTMAAFTEVVGLKRYSVYVFDYGAPTGFRMALKNPERITAIISQNGNAYEEGLSKAWAPIQAYWKEPSAANRNALRPLMTFEMTKWQYLEGVKDKSKVSPDGYTLAQVALDRPGNIEVQLDLFGDYQSNVDLYPRFQAYFRDRKPPLLAVWGRNDPFFLAAGAEAYKRDNANAEVHFYDTGHFALETHAQEIGAEVLRFLDRVTDKR